MTDMKFTTSLVAIAIALATSPAVAGAGAPGASFPREFVGTWCPTRDDPKGGAWEYFERGDGCSDFVKVNRDGSFDAPMVHCKLTRKDFDRRGDAGRALRGYWRYTCHYKECDGFTEITAVKFMHDAAPERLLMTPLNPKGPKE